jgi:hypothetical protein
LPSLHANGAIHQAGTGLPTQSCAKLVNQRVTEGKPIAAVVIACGAGPQSHHVHIEHEGQLSQKVGFLLRDD